MPAIICSILGVAFFVLLIIIFSGIKVVEQQSALIIETFGKFSKILHPGFHVIIPFVQQTRAKIYLFGQNLDFSIVAITSDKVTVTLDTTLIYHVIPEKIYLSYYAVANPIAVMKTTVENSIRSYVALQTHEEILQKRDEMTLYLVEHLREKFESWGREIDAFQVKDVVLPSEITSAMSKVISSKRLQEAAEFEGNAKKILMIRTAEAEKATRQLSGEGIAAEREAIINGLKVSVENMRAATGASAESVMNVVMLTQYLDTMKNLGNSQNTKVVFMNSNPGSMDEIMKQMYGMIK